MHISFQDCQPTTCTGRRRGKKRNNPRSFSHAHFLARDEGLAKAGREGGKRDRKREGKKKYKLIWNGELAEGKNPFLQVARGELKRWHQSRCCRCCCCCCCCRGDTSASATHHHHHHITITTTSRTDQQQLAPPPPPYSPSVLWHWRRFYGGEREREVGAVGSQSRKFGAKLQELINIGGGEKKNCQRAGERERESGVGVFVMGGGRGGVGWLGGGGVVEKGMKEMCGFLDE